MIGEFGIRCNNRGAIADSKTSRLRWMLGPEHHYRLAPKLKKWT